ncbi:hypothetical protein [Heyndrickxia ginsengihumi]
MALFNRAVYLLTHPAFLWTVEINCSLQLTQQNKVKNKEDVTLWEALEV